jgi:hypothetical protein
MTPPPSPLSPSLRFLLAFIAVVVLQGMAPDPRPAVHSLSAVFTRSIRLEPRHAVATANLVKTLAHRASELVCLPQTWVKRPPVKPVRTYRIIAIRTSRSEDRFRPVPALAHSPSAPFLWPVQGRVSSGYGMRYHPITRQRTFHPAIDILARPGTPVLAPTDGVVTAVGRAGGMGRMVKIRTGSGLTLYFGHLSAYRCAVGQRIRRGQIIGLVGSTGRSTGPHLHFSVMRAGRSINPLTLLPPRGR